MGLLRVRHDWATSLSLFTSCIGEGNGNPLQCSCQEYPRDRGAWWAAVYEVAQSQTWLKRLSNSSSSSKRHGLTVSVCYCSVDQSCETDSLWSRELQHVWLPCPSLSSGVCSNSCPLSPWCHLTISSSVVPFSFCLQSFPASGSFPMSWLFTSGDQSIGASASA